MTASCNMRAVQRRRILLLGPARTKRFARREERSGGIGPPEIIGFNRIQVEQVVLAFLQRIPCRILWVVIAHDAFRCHGKPHSDPVFMDGVHPIRGTTRGKRTGRSIHRRYVFFEKSNHPPGRQTYGVCFQIGGFTGYMLPSLPRRVFSRGFAGNGSGSRKGRLRSTLLPARFLFPGRKNSRRCRNRQKHHPGTEPKALDTWNPVKQGTDRNQPEIIFHLWEHSSPERTARDFSF